MHSDHAISIDRRLVDRYLAPARRVRAWRAVLCRQQNSKGEIMQKLPMAAVLVLAFGLSAATASAGGVPRATGSGHFRDDVSGVDRTFTFTADGTDGGRGQAQIVRHDTGVRVHIAIDCVKFLNLTSGTVLGRAAIMSGFATQASSPDVEGQYFLFAVVTGGEPSAGVDCISFASTVDPNAIDCQSNVQIFVRHPTEGNVQVR